ncbi:MAG: FAD synthetase family protein, partial [Treponema sp.]|nr:FAD synthetase family protein [Treponema sp.]
MSLRIIKWDELEDPSCDFRTAQSAVTVGVFDGVHLGHAELIRRIVARGPNPTVLTFRESPKKLLSPGSYPGDIYSLKKKLEVFEDLGVERTVLIDFSENFSKLKGPEFMELLETRLNISSLVIGVNFHCGFKQDVGADFIQKLNEKRGVLTEIVEPVIESSLPVSSSRIRIAVKNGDLKTASLLLGRNFSLDLRNTLPFPMVKAGKTGWTYDFLPLKRVIPASGSYDAIVHNGSRD